MLSQVLKHISLTVLSAAALTMLVPPASAQVYTYQTTIGTTGAPGSGNNQFSLNGLTVGAVDTVNGHLFVADVYNQRVQVFDLSTLAYVATLGVNGASGSDNTHFNAPADIAFDPVTNRILVADQNNVRVQIFDAKTFAYVQTLGTTGVAGTDNAHFNSPTTVKLNLSARQLYVTDVGNERVQIFNLDNYGYIATLGTTGVTGSDNTHFWSPSDAEFNEASNQILVTDSTNFRVQIFNASSFAYVQTLGSTRVMGTDNSHFTMPATASYDPASGLVLVGDTDRVQIFDAHTYAYVATLGTARVVGSDNAHFNQVIFGITADPAHSRIFIGDTDNERIQVYSTAPSPLHAAVLPGARSLQVGSTATIFATLLNAGSTALNNCRIALPVSAPPGLSLTYQTTDPSTNALSGTPNTPATIGANNAFQTFVVSFQSTTAISDLAQPLDFACDGVAPAGVVPAVDTVDLVFSETPIADIIALVGVASGNGILEIPQGSTGAFALATDNEGASAPLTVQVDTGSAALPLSLSICQTNPSTGACLAPPAAHVNLTIAAGATPTFAIFATATGPIAFNPAGTRVFVRFIDASGGSHGSTSVAVETTT